MRVSQPRCAVVVCDPNGPFLEGSRILGFTCCDVEPAILGESFTGPLDGDLEKVLMLHSKERPSPHDDRR